MKALSQTTKYGLRALIYLASSVQEGNYINIREISDELKLSFHFLTRIFRQLTNNQILVSYRGPGGGIALARPANQIMLIDVLVVLEGKDYFDQCLLGLPGCGSAKPCPVHDFWKTIKTELQDYTSVTSIAGLADKVKADEVRLYD